MQYAWNAFLSPWWLTEGVRVPPEFVFFTRRRRRRVSIYIKYTCRRLETHLNACLQIQFKRLLKENALHVKKTKRCRGANPRPMVLNASALPLPHTDLQFIVPFPRHMTYDKSYHHREEIKYNSRSGVVVGRWRSKP